MGRPGCNAEDPGLIPEFGRSAEEGIGYPLQHEWVSPVAQLVKNLPADLGSIPGVGRSPGEGEGYPLQDSGLEDSMNLHSPWGRRESDVTETFTFAI